MVRFIEVGRVVFHNSKWNTNKIGVITEVIDKKRVIIDGPIGKRITNTKRIIPTKFLISILNGISSAKLYYKILNEKVLGKWFSSSWGKKILKKEKLEKFSDYDRFKYMIGRKHRKLNS